jgi:hypothetical protein
MRKYAYPGLKDEIHTSIMITTGYLTWIHHLTQLNVGLERERERERERRNAPIYKKSNGKTNLFVQNIYASQPYLHDGLNKCPLI